MVSKSSNGSGTVVLSGQEEVVPFFDFYIFAESTEPPNATELAHSETPVLIFNTREAPPRSTFVDVTAGTKALKSPIIIAQGTNARSPLRVRLALIDPRDHANLLATTICHEIGHTFGLRHSVALIDQPPYVLSDAAFSRGTMASSGTSGNRVTPRMPLGFFGPVHVGEIGRIFL